MTAEELSYNFFLAYDKAFEGAAPGYDDKQVSSWLSQGQYRVFDKYYSVFEQSELSRRALDPLIKSTTISAFVTGVHPNGYLTDLPSDFMYATEESIIASGQSTETTVVPVTHDFYQKNKGNPYKQPKIDGGIDDLVWRMDIGLIGATKRTELITDGTDITSYRLEYLQQITDIVIDSLTPGNSVDPILDVTVHYEIITEAVKIAVAATKPDEYQIASLENNSN